MTKTNQQRLTLLGVVVLAVLAGLFVYPKSLGSLSWLQRPLNLGLDLQGGAHLVYEADMASIPDGERDEALVGVRDVIERRVNVFGVSEPLVQTNRTGTHYRIIVELPGVRDVDQAIAGIGQTPRLEFREMSAGDDAETIRPTAEAALLQIQSGERTFEEVAKAESADTVSAQGDPAGDIGFVKRDQTVTEFDKAIFDDLQVGETTTQPVQTVFGFHLIKKTDQREVPKADGSGTETEVRASHILYAVKQPQYVPTGLAGQHLERAQVVVNQTGQTEVSLRFNKEGSDLFEQITQRNLGKQVAIYLDGAPISVPTVNQVISGGEAVISGNFTVEEARQLARNLNAGALPVPITLVNQLTIGSSLGGESLQRSLLAGLFGTLAVALFMMICYRLPGFLAVCALLLYALFTLAAFKLLGVTLTLAGIAGFILSIGMAVDANVLIFERLREELRAGATLAEAVRNGFQRAWPSIRDSNISSLITCFVLSWLGTGLVKGFAVTLALGIIVSMFTAITVTRTFLRLFVSPRISLWWFGVKSTPNS